MGGTDWVSELRDDGDKKASEKTIGDYIHISTALPLVMAAAVLLFAVGIIVWATQVKVDMNVGSMAVASGKTVIIPLDDNYLGIVRKGQNVDIDEHKCVITAINRSDGGMYYCIARCDDDLSAGIYEANIVTNQVRPFEMIFSAR